MPSVKLIEFVRPELLNGCPKGIFKFQVDRATAVALYKDDTTNKTANLLREKYGTPLEAGNPSFSYALKQNWNTYIVTFIPNER